MKNGRTSSQTKHGRTSKYVCTCKNVSILKKNIGLFKSTYKVYNTFYFRETDLPSQSSFELDEVQVQIIINKALISLFGEVRFRFCSFFVNLFLKCFYLF